MHASIQTVFSHLLCGLLSLAATAGFRRSLGKSAIVDLDKIAAFASAQKHPFRAAPLSQRQHLQPIELGANPVDSFSHMVTLANG